MKTLKQLREKTLTPAEKKKREEIAKAIEKDDPDMPMDKKMAIATATAKKVAEAVDLDEAFTPKEIKMAIGVASDKRYAGGNMTGAVKAIEKIKKGLSDHPQVKVVLRRQNESLGEATDFRKGDTVFQVGSKLKGTVLHKGNRDEVVVKFGSVNKSIPASKLRLAEGVELDEAAPKLKGNDGPYTRQQIEKAAKEAKVDIGAKSRMMMALRNMK